MSTNKRKYFGTDGIRGQVGVEPVTPDFMMKLGWAIGRVLAKNGTGPVLIGKDTRISGYMFESALEAGLSASGVDIRLLGPMPTPGIAYLTQNTRAQAGIAISASHNPYHDNGIKLFSADGKKLPDKVEREIEAELCKPLQVVNSGMLGKARRMSDAPRRYIEFCKSKVGPDCDLSSLHIIIDCAHGAGYHIAPKVFEELGASVESIGVAPNGLNINEGFGAISPGALQKSVLENGADLGIALDGDGDRLIMVDHTGEIVDGDEILYIITKAKQDTVNGAIVGTLMSNLGLEQAVNLLDLGFYRANVGDRYVMEMLLQRNLKLGGESSGHIINLNLSNAGDGIISALQILESMVFSSQSLHGLKSGMHKYPQKLINLKLQPGVDPSSFPELGKLVNEVENELGNSGRVLLRPSGTEPLLRIMVEGDDDVQVGSLAHLLADRIESILQK